MTDEKALSSGFPPCPSCGSTVVRHKMRVAAIVFAMLGATPLTEVGLHIATGQRIQAKAFLPTGIFWTLAVLSSRPVKARCLACGKTFRLPNASPGRLGPGDRVRTTTDAAPVKLGERTLATVERGRELTAIQVRGNWAKVSLAQGGDKVTGWIHRRCLKRLPGLQPEMRSE